MIETIKSTEHKHHIGCSSGTTEDTVNVASAFRSSSLTRLAFLARVLRYPGRSQTYQDESDLDVAHLLPPTHPMRLEDAKIGLRLSNRSPLCPEYYFFNMPRVIAVVSWLQHCHVADETVITDVDVLGNHVLGSDR